MNLRQLQALAKQGESETLEFKKSTALLRAIFETICAFLNGKGGTILIGINDKGELIGQDVSDNTRQEIAKELHKIEPPVHLETHYVSLDKNKTVIAIQVIANAHAPYIYDGRAFQRHQSTTSKMPQHRYEQLLVARGQLNYSWENMIAEGYKITDLDREEIFKTVTGGISENRIPASAQRDNIKAILKRLELIEGDQLKNAAVALYVKSKSLRFMHCMIKMARFKGTDHLGEFIDNQQIKANCFALLEAADSFIKRNFTIASTFKPDQFKRIDTPTLPVMAVREALINAICHRDYGKQGTDISMAMFDDRLEIWNSGLPPAPLKIKDLKRRHKSVLRNELIANAFYVRGFIEKWGTGINKIMDLCKADGVPQPQFEELTGGLLITFRFRSPIGPSKIENKSDLTDRQKEILTLLKQSSLNGAQMLNKLKGLPAIRTVQVDLTQLEKLGLIKREGKARATAWKLIKND